jgi:hypothetical protein
VRDERPFAGARPPAALFCYSPDRKGEHPRVHRTAIIADSVKSVARIKSKGNFALKLSLEAITLFCADFLVQNKPVIYGYARVSTDGQSVTAQVTELRKRLAQHDFAAMRALEKRASILVGRLSLSRAVRRANATGYFGLQSVVTRLADRA